MNKDNIQELTPIEILRSEKRELYRLCRQDETRLAASWEYMSDNINTLLFNSLVGKVTSFIPFVGRKKEKEVHAPSAFGAPTIMSGVMSVLPLAWELAQPLLLGYATKKIKSLFFGSDDKEKKEK